MPSYTLGPQISSGSSGTVYSFGGGRVLKKIEQDEGVRNLLEIDILFRLHHPNLLHGIDLYIGSDRPPIDSFADNTMGIVLPRFTGTLRDLLRSQTYIHPEMRLKYFIDICRGVQHLHMNDIAHLDIKASNLLYRSNPDDPYDIKEIVVADFGLSRFTSNGRTFSDSPLVTALTRPPENLVGSREYGKHTDIWSLGILAVELLGGHVLKENFYIGVAHAYEALKYDEELSWASRFDFCRFLKKAYSTNVRSSRELAQLLERRGKEWGDTGKREDRLRQMFRGVAQPETVDLFIDLLQVDPRKRPSIDEVLARLEPLDPVSPVPSFDPVSPVPSEPSFSWISWISSFLWDPSESPDGKISKSLRRFYRELYLEYGETLDETALRKAQNLFDLLCPIGPEESPGLERRIERDFLQAVSLWIVAKSYGLTLFGTTFVTRAQEIFGWDGNNLHDKWDEIPWVPGNPLVPSSVIVIEREILSSFRSSMFG